MQKVAREDGSDSKFDDVEKIVYQAPVDVLRSGMDAMLLQPVVETPIIAPSKAGTMQLRDSAVVVSSPSCARYQRPVRRLTKEQRVDQRGLDHDIVDSQHNSFTNRTCSKLCSRSQLVETCGHGIFTSDT